MRAASISSGCSWSNAGGPLVAHAEQRGHRSSLPVTQVASSAGRSRTARRRRCRGHRGRAGAGGASHPAVVRAPPAPHPVGIPAGQHAASATSRRPRSRCAARTTSDSLRRGRRRGRPPPARRARRPREPSARPPCAITVLLGSDRTKGAALLRSGDRHRSRRGSPHLIEHLFVPQAYGNADRWRMGRPVERW